MDYSILVNRDNECSDIKEEYLVKVDTMYKNDVIEPVTDIYLEKETYSRWLDLKKEAAKKGYRFEIIGGFRTFEYQKCIMDYFEQQIGLEAAKLRVAEAGHSEHETGLAIDYTYLRLENDELNDKEIEEEDKEYLWIKENMHKYGFILRYPMGKENITGYRYEPWHIRYVGYKTAETIYNEGLTYEEYYNKYIKKQKKLRK